MFEEKRDISESEEPPFGSTKKTVSVEHDDGEGNWLVSYADLMTLLFGFFVILSAMSTPDPDKIEAMKKATSEQMGGEYSVPFEDVGNEIKKILADINLDKDVIVIQNEKGVTIQSKGTLFFASGSSSLLPRAQSLVTNIADVLVESGQGYRIVVEGHTDDLPIRSRLFPSNWELSASRASTVVRLLEDKGFSRQHLSPIGFADTQPLVPNVNEQGIGLEKNRAENRRIVIRVQKQTAYSAK